MSVIQNPQSQIQNRPSRRDFILVGSLTTLGLGLTDYFALRTAAAAPFAPLGTPLRAFPTAHAAARAKSCILIWLDGGPSHLETFDLKPGAPAEVRGPFRATKTNVAGIEICDLFAGLAQRMDRAAIIRSMTSPLGEHNLGTHYMLTGYQPTPALEYPAFGSVVAHLDPAERTLPKHIAVPNFGVGGKRISGNGYLPLSTRPFEVGGDPARPDFGVEHLGFYTGLSHQRIDRRREYLAALDRLTSRADAGAAPTAKPFEQAYRLVTSPEAKAAFDLTQESDETRRRYGPRTIGQSTLLARRLVEAGVPFVTVNYPGWDTHDNLYTRLKEGYTGAKEPVGLIPSLDLALSALLDDLHDRGRLEETLVVVMGEFGRTPKVSTAGGRDHWPRVFSVLLAGGGVPGGQVIGSSDATGESPKERPVTPADLAATIYTLLGIDPHSTLTTNDGRPLQISRDGKPLLEVVG